MNIIIEYIMNIPCARQGAVLHIRGREESQTMKEDTYTLLWAVL